MRSPPLTPSLPACMLLFSLAASLTKAQESTGGTGGGALGAYELVAATATAKPVELPELELLLLDEEKEQAADASVGHRNGIGKNEAVDDVDVTSLNVPCGIWLAPSTLPGAGMGMFAGRAFEEDEDLQALGDVAIPIVDIRGHHDGGNGDEDWPFLWDEYTWSAETLGMSNEGVVDVNAASPGFGSAANSFLPLVNVEEWSTVSDGAGLHRSSDPGAGAFTTYHNRRSTAKRRIEPGEELFVDYGDEWFTGRKHLGPIPLYEDLDWATDLFQSYQELRERVRMSSPNPSEAYKALPEEVWNEFVRDTSFTDSRILGAFRHDDDDERRALEDGLSLREIRLRQSARSVEWLQERGTCADHIRAGPSTIRQAGRGAFATRFLPSETVVSQLPLIHVPDRDVMVMYELGTDPETGEGTPDPELGPMGYQLMLNYCYGHNESTLLLCPYGPAVNLVNHNQTRANVRLRWVEDPAKVGNHVPELLNEPIERLLSNGATAKLAMELVAIRDIQPGEEVLLDYGDEWERAWEEHVQDWEPEPDAMRYTSASQLNRDDANERLRTEFEQQQDPYPSSVELVCEAYFLGDHWRQLDEEELQFELEELELQNREKWLPCELLQSRADDDDDDDEDQDQDDGDGEKTLLYTAVIFELPSDDVAMVDYDVELEDVPRRAFKFVDRPYTTDMFLANAFRHDIRIPDNMFPDQWRNLRP